MTTRFLNSLMFSAAIVCSIGSVSEAANMNYLGGWSNAVIYKPGSVVVYNSGIYYSLKSTKPAPNRNYIPSTNPSWWQQVGTVGNTILSGPGNPFDQSLGQAGDFYLNTTTSTLFGPKTAIAPYWPASGTSLVGSGGGAGTQGPVGATGPQGDTGPAGATGPAGSTGPAGPLGATGPVAPGLSVFGADNARIGTLLAQSSVLISSPSGLVVVGLDSQSLFLDGTPAGISISAISGVVTIYYSDYDCAGTGYLNNQSLIPPTGYFIPSSLRSSEGTLLVPQVEAVGPVPTLSKWIGYCSNEYNSTLRNNVVQLMPSAYSFSRPLSIR